MQQQLLLLLLLLNLASRSFGNCLLSLEFNLLLLLGCQGAVGSSRGFNLQRLWGVQLVLVVVVLLLLLLLVLRCAMAHRRRKGTCDR